ncbi:YfdX family protein [Salmonella enterica subsp. enterica serovar Bareilly]|nr:YfdX family protein [Salmonella enterica subsp. enterica serovar Bareilly]HDI5132665.1 YfdX family protein [Salmonella enterica subsp. enterica serovar Paratyphi C]ECL9402170.1 YfdX family protein [Salmonella enterica subsp. enterica serovar Bareilly]EHE7684197.1 YfdX family protein [Salmonella enterica subsp. enterica serovar Bareilly]EII4646878.1 YfdX family protein [Salmonella enterica subsp. enterica serovar Bareilly]
MKKSILAMALTTVLGVSGAAFADTGAAPHTAGSSPLTASQWRTVDNIAKIGNEAMQDVQLARVSLFNGDTKSAKKLLSDAQQKINDDKTDWTKFIKKDKKTPVDGDNYIVINASMSISEDYQASDEKTKAIKNANEKLKKGDKKGAIETLKLAGITVVENEVLMPLKQTRTDIQKAIAFFDDGKYYQANLMLLSAEEGIILDSETIQE